MGSDVLIVVVILLVIVLIWQGPKNLPKLGSALGRSISDFRKEVSTDEKPAESTAAPPTAPAPPTTPTTPTDQPGA
ncbi:MAG TPA: twin-arginine translocase TatA/TatE family subunit [Candidatus Limnocylindrales bacterium]|nr:twin-arginine translocase TatA/TatE family subunit [Candidatus Limnocylindrales bacterium]